MGGIKAVTSKSNNDLIVTVEDGKVTLKNAANLSKINIVETPINFSNDRNKVTVNGTNANDTITNVGEKISVIAQGGNDSIINNNKGVNSTISGCDGMKNHALDEILADCLGQIAAFGNFDGDRQRIFFRLEKGGSKCTGRLQFYCQKVSPLERPKIYSAVDKFIDEVLIDGKSKLEILCELARRRLAKKNS